MSKNTLQEYCQSLGKDVPTYSLLKQQGPQHSPAFVSVVTLWDGRTFAGREETTKTKSEKSAAQAALDAVLADRNPSAPEIEPATPPPTSQAPAVHPSTYQPQAYPPSSFMTPPYNQPNPGFMSPYGDSQASKSFYVPEMAQRDDQPREFSYDKRRMTDMVCKLVEVLRREQTLQVKAIRDSLALPGSVVDDLLGMMRDAALVDRQGECVSLVFQSVFEPCLTEYAVVRESENRNIEFKDVNLKYIGKILASTVNGFLNTEGGSLCFGISDSGIVTGCSVGREAMDHVRLALSRATHNFYPPLEPELYQVHFIPVRRVTAQLGEMNETLCVIRIDVQKGRYPVYEDEGKAYIRRDASTHVMATQMKHQRLIDYGRTGAAMPPSPAPGTPQRPQFQ